MAAVIGDERNQHRTGVRLKDWQMFRQVSTEYGQSVRFHWIQTFVDSHGIVRTSAKFGSTEYYLSRLWCALWNVKCLLVAVLELETFEAKNDTLVRRCLDFPITLHFSEVRATDQ